MKQSGSDHYWIEIIIDNIIWAATARLSFVWEPVEIKFPISIIASAKKLQLLGKILKGI